MGAEGAVAAVWPQSMLSGSSPRLCGKPVWWAPQHDGVAGSGQVRVYAAGIGRLGSELASLKPMQRRRGGALAPRRTSTIRPKTRGRAAGRPSRRMVIPGRRGGEGDPPCTRGQGGPQALRAARRTRDVKPVAVGSAAMAASKAVQLHSSALELGGAGLPSRRSTSLA